MKKIIGALTVLSVLVPSLAFASVNISLVGGGVTVPQGQTFVEPGFSAFSTLDGDVTGQVAVTNPGTSQVGDFTVGYFVTDSNNDSASAARDLTVTGGAGMIPCSGPMAYGWNVSLPGGGCPGQTSTFVQFNHALPDGTPCEFFSGCMVK
jgi:hypothetical protein